jgi:hypothetical protein
MHGLLTEKVLEKYDDSVLKWLQTTPNNYVVDATHLAYGRAFLRFILFQELSGLITALNLGECERFYNLYFWARRFANLYQAVHGLDAGIEQGVFMSLEHAPTEADWTIIESIDTAAKSGSNT